MRPSYLAIQNIRFKDKFEFQVNADPNLLKLSVPEAFDSAVA